MIYIAPLFDCFGHGGDSVVLVLLLVPGPSFGPGFMTVMPNGISHYYQLDESISNLRVVGW